MRDATSRARRQAAVLDVLNETDHPSLTAGEVLRALQARPDAGWVHAVGDPLTEVRRQLKLLRDEGLVAYNKGFVPSGHYAYFWRTV